MDVLRGDGGDGMSAIEHFVLGQDVGPQVPHVDGPFAEFRDAVSLVGKVRSGDDRVNARHRDRGGDIKPPDPGVGVRTAKNVSGQLAREPGIGPVAGASSDLVGAVMPDRRVPMTLYFDFFADFLLFGVAIGPSGVMEGLLAIAGWRSIRHVGPAGGDEAAWFSLRPEWTDAECGRRGAAPGGCRWLCSLRRADAGRAIPRSPSVR